MLIKDIMTPHPISILPSVSVAEAGELMTRHRIRHLPVVDQSGHLLGLVTRTSLSNALPGMGTGLTRFEFSYLTTATRVGEIMIKNPAVISEEEAVEEAARIMSVNQISSLLVMRDGELVGIITDTDLFKAMLEMLGGGRPGVRLIVHIPDEAGALAKVTSAVAKPGGYLSAVGGWYIKDAKDVYGAVLKIENLTREQVVAAMQELPGVTIVDVRGEAVMHQA